MVSSPLYLVRCMRSAIAPTDTAIALSGCDTAAAKRILAVVHCALRSRSCLEVFDSMGNSYFVRFGLAGKLASGMLLPSRWHEMLLQSCLLV